jgi:predicted nucleic acid-binding protein
VPRAVPDASVLASALASPGGPGAALLLELRAGAFGLVVSPLLLPGLREVVTTASPTPAAGAAGL